MTRFWLTFIFLCFSFLSFCLSTDQQGQNPFDIISVVDSVSHLSPQDSLTANIFDINTEQSIENHDSTVSVVDTITSYTQKPSDNPFDISSGSSLSKIRKHKISQEISTAAKKSPITQYKQKKEKKPSPDGRFTFLFWPILLCTITLAFIVNIKGNVLAQNLKALTNNNVLKLNQRIENNGLTVPYIALYFVYLIGSAVFLHLVLNSYSSFSILSTFLGCLLFVFSVYLTRHLFLFFVGRCFELSSECDHYSFTIVSYNLLFGILLIPLNLLLIFGPDTLTNYLLLFGVVVFAILFAIRILRGIHEVLPLLLRNKLQFFTYLCTFEILPLLIFIKVVYL